MKAATHTGRVTNSNYGQPYSYDVSLYETAKFWVNTKTGAKYRKATGTPAASTIWNQTTLELDTVKPL